MTITLKYLKPAHQQQLFHQAKQSVVQVLLYVALQNLGEAKGIENKYVEM
jgi:hypothetical protein